jgi:hypothetical protein
MKKIHRHTTRTHKQNNKDTQIRELNRSTNKHTKKKKNRT